MSTIRFRSFKDLRLNPASILFVLFVMGSSLAVSQIWKPQFVLVWLLGVYITIGVVESIRALAQWFLRAPARDTAPPPPAE